MGLALGTAGLSSTLGTVVTEDTEGTEGTADGKVLPWVAGGRLGRLGRLGTGWAGLAGRTCEPNDGLMNCMAPNTIRWLFALVACWTG